MKNWKDFWQNYRTIETKSQEDLLYQVGKTVGGKVVSKEQFKADVAEIENYLDLQHNDVLFDLCCGNGVLTMQFANKVQQIVGLDFSEAYIKNAKKFNTSAHVSFAICDSTDIEQVAIYLEQFKPNKVLMNDCLAYFSEESLADLLSELSKRKVVILISSILDRDRKWNFYNTTNRKISYLIDTYFRNQKSGLGKWWRKQSLIILAKKYGFECKVFDHHKLNHTSHYRFNILLKK